MIELFGLGFGVFAITTVYPYIIETFPDWSRTTVFAPTSIVIITTGALAPVTGAFLDRYPIRVLFVAGIVTQSVALLLFSRVTTPTAISSSPSFSGSASRASRSSRTGSWSRAGSTRGSGS